jgi:hypothetical protein
LPSARTPPARFVPLDDNAIDERPEVRALLAAIKQTLPTLEALLVRLRSHWGYEDPIYRFYHQSYKVFGLQQATIEVVDSLRALAPEMALNPWFLEIVEQGTGRRFRDDTNANWIAETRPILEAFFHARFFLEMVVVYGKKLASPPRLLPSGWAAVLYLYGLR